MSEAGRPYAAVTAGNNSDQKVRNAWGRLTRRVRRDHPDFPRHSFGKLRKTAASWVRKTGGGELASIFIAHGKATGDGLLDLYADRQFTQLYRCQKRVWRRLAGVLTGPFPEPRAKNPTVRSLGNPLVRRIQRLRTQGYTLAAIAEMTHTPLPTVKQAARARPPADRLTT